MPNSVVVIDKKSDWTPWIVAGGVAAAGVGLYLWSQSKKQEEGTPTGLKITSYKNLRSGVTINAPGVLSVQKGDGVRVSFQWSYKGPALSGGYHVAVAKKGTLGLNELGTPTEVPFTVEESSASVIIKAAVDVVVNWIGISPGEVVGLYVKIQDIPGADIDHFLPNVIRVEEEVQYSFSIGAVYAYPSSAPPGPVLIRWPVTSIGYSGEITVRCNVYEAAFWPTPGKRLWYQDIKRNIGPSETLDLEFLFRSDTYPSSSNGYDVGCQVFVAGKEVKEAFAQDVFVVTPRYVSFLMSINPDGAVAAFPGADRWMAYYWDPETERFVGDGKVYYLSGILGIPENDIAFEHVAPGGYLAVFLYDIETMTYSQQFTSEEWTAQHGYDYEFDPLSGRIYEI